MKYEQIMKSWEKRAIKIVFLRDEEDMSWADIGRKFCISRQRAQQIYQKQVEK